MEYRKYIELVMNNGVWKVYWTSKGIMEYRKYIGLVKESWSIESILDQ